MSNIILPKTKLTVALVAIKRTTTKDGLCSLSPRFRVGDKVLVDSATIAQKRINFPNGISKDYSTICIVDEFGSTHKNDKGENDSWIFFECIEIDAKDAKIAGVTTFQT